MKQFLTAVLIAALGIGFVATDAEAKRLGGGISQGMKRQAPPPQAPAAPPAKQAAPAAAPGNNAAVPPSVAPKRSWMGPLAGIAAGLGIGALLSHFGMGGLGAGFGGLLMVVLFAVAAFFIIRMVMSKMRPQASVAGAGAGAGPSFGSQNLPFTGSAQPRADNNVSAFAAAAPAAAFNSFGGAAPVAVQTASRFPEGFDTQGFERIAKLIFIRMQAANDSCNLDDLRQFSTPEMYAAFRLDIQDRQNAAQTTDVVKLEAQAIDYAEEDAKQIVSVRFHGLLREETGGPANPFDETWHLVKPADGSSTQWLIAGIAQNALAA